MGGPLGGVLLPSSYRREREHTTATSTAYLNNPVELTAKTLAFFTSSSSGALI